MIVSVPYRGATFLNDNYTYEEAQKLLKSFRPLSGSYISQLYSVHDEKFDINVSVPYRGATFLN